MPGVGWVTGRRVLGPGVTRAAASSQTQRPGPRGGGEGSLDSQLDWTLELELELELAIHKVFTLTEKGLLLVEIGSLTQR